MSVRARGCARFLWSSSSSLDDSALLQKPSLTISVLNNAECGLIVQCAAVLRESFWCCLLKKCYWSCAESVWQERGDAHILVTRPGSGCKKCRGGLQDLDWKLDWVREAAMVVDPRHPQLAVHVPVILQPILQILQHEMATRPELAHQIRPVLHVINASLRQYQ